MATKDNVTLTGPAKRKPSRRTANTNDAPLPANVRKLLRNMTRNRMSLSEAKCIIAAGPHKWTAEQLTDMSADAQQDRAEVELYHKRRWITANSVVNDGLSDAALYKRLMDLKQAADDHLAKWGPHRPFAYYCDPSDGPLD